MSEGELEAEGRELRDPSLADFSGVATSAADLLAAAEGKRLPPVDIPMTHQERLSALRQARRKGRRPRHGTKLESVALRGEIVRLRISGLKAEEIGELVGLTSRSVNRHVERWVMEQTPAPDQAETLRMVMQERLEFMHSTYWNIANGLSINGERVPGREPEPKAGEMVLKIMDRQAKLMGVDLQPNTTTILISAESIAAYLGWDDAPQGPLALAPSDVVDVEASVIEDE